MPMTFTLLQSATHNTGDVIKKVDPMSLKAVIFDHDGTLVDSEKMHYGIWREVLSGFNVDFPEADYARGYSGFPTRHNARTLVDTYKLDIDPEALFRLKEQRVNGLLAREPFHLMPGVKEIINACQQLELSLAIASGARRNEVANTLNIHGLTGIFNAIACSEDVVHPKPAPDVYLLALSNLGLAAEQCIAVEDSYSGLQSAKAAGLRCIVVPNVYSASHDFSQADVIAEGLAGAIGAINKISNGA